MPHLSNSAYSTHRTAHGAARAPPPVQHFMAEFYAQNALGRLTLGGAPRPPGGLRAARRGRVAFE